MDISFYDGVQQYFGKSRTKPGQYSSLALAYIGDGVFDLIIRTIILDMGNGKSRDFHRVASSIVKAPSQAKIIRSVLDELTEEEMACLLYTSDAADDLLCVDLGGRRIIKKKKKKETTYY